ncbi:hypothetical protein [Planctomycetes bacterium Pan216]|uniref:hypothetical protein n=1 Tax=Kolteria novifilia TaxID=2527975 RepID=UPI0011AA62E8
MRRDGNEVIGILVISARIGEIVLSPSAGKELLVHHADTLAVGSAEGQWLALFQDRKPVSLDDEPRGSVIDIGPELDPIVGAADDVDKLSLRRTESTDEIAVGRRFTYGVGDGTRNMIIVVATPFARVTREQFAVEASCAPIMIMAFGAISIFGLVVNWLLREFARSLLGSRTALSRREEIRDRADGMRNRGSRWTFEAGRG